MKNSGCQEVVRKLFDLPEEEDILDDFACALKKKIFIQGRLFCTDNYLCFYASILGFKTKQVIPFQQVKSIKRRKGHMSNTIEIGLSNLKTVSLGGFIRRNEAFQFIFSLWRNSGYCDESQDTGYWSDSEDPPPLEEEKEGITMLPTEESGDVYETLKVIVPVSPQRYFDLFIKDECEYPIQEYMNDKGHTEIECTPWSYNEEMLGHTRELKFRIELVGNSIGPKSTRCHLVQWYQLSEGAFKMKTSSKALDVPYSSYFVVEEEWDVNEVGPDKSMVKSSVKVNFLKSTVFGSKIVAKTKEDVTSNNKEWFKRAKKLIFDDGGAVEEEKDLPQLAKYDEVNLKMFNNKRASQKGPTQYLMYVNTVLIAILYLYVSVLHGWVNEIYDKINNT